MVGEVEVYTQIDLFVVNYVCSVVVNPDVELFGSVANVLLLALGTRYQIDQVT